MKMRKAYEAFAILLRYDEEAQLDAQHDIIYCGPDSADVSPEDAAKLTELGFHIDSEVGGWAVFT